MQKNIFPRQPDESDADFYRRLAGVFNGRATQFLRDGRNPEQPSMLAAAYGEMSRQAADAANSFHGGER